MNRLLRGAIQPQLTVGPADDKYEREADRVADEVMRMPDPAPRTVQRSPIVVQRMCAECEEEEPLQRKPIQSKTTSLDVPTVSPSLGSYLTATRGGGTPLSPAARAFFEPRFGREFGHVRVHTDARAAEASSEISARAFTTGSDIYFALGHYSPGTAAGNRLLGHELTHVIQQRAAPSDLRRHDGVNGVHTLTVPPQLTSIQRQPGAGAARTAVRRALIWLGRRGATVSRHVARHTRGIAGRAVHSVFSRPNQVKKLVRRTLQAPDNVLTQSGRRVRYVVEKQFGRVIGKNGETILHVVIEASGRIVTAYPVRAFTAASVAFLLIDEASAEAREQLEDLENRAQRAMEAAEPSFWEDVVLDFVTFGLYGGQLNAGEDVGLWLDREVADLYRRTCDNVIRSVEESEQASLGPEERRAICDLVGLALIDPDMIDELETETMEGVP